MGSAWWESPAARAASEAGEFGTLLRMARRARGLSQRDAGTILGCSYVSVSRYETSQQRLVDVNLLRLVSQKMGIPPQMLGLSPDQAGAAEAMQRRRVFSGLASSAFVLPTLTSHASTMLAGLDSVLFGVSRQAQPLSRQALTSVLSAVRQDFTACRWSELAAKVPNLIKVAVVSRSHAGYDERGLFDSLLSDAYVLGNQLAIKLHEPEVSWVLADRAMQAATASGDPRALARAQWRMAVSLRRSRHKDMAVRMLSDAAEQLRRANDLETAWDAGFYARMLCSAAYTAALADRRAQAYGYLEHAREVAAECPRSPFSSTDIDLYGISVARAVGDFGQAVDLARSIRLGLLPETERQVRYWEDTAIALWGRGRPAETFQAMLAAERLAPQEVRLRPWAHRITVNLLSLGPRTGLSGVREFAIRAGVAATA